MDKRTASILGLAVGAAACMPRFQPTVPMRAQSGDVDLVLKEVRVGGLQDVVFESRSTRPHTIHRARLTVATRAPCTGGADAAWIQVDGGPVPASFLPPGTHEVRARFQDSANAFVLDLVMDFDLEDGGCARAPVVSQSVPMFATKRFVVVGSMDTTGTTDISGLRSFIVGRLGAGAWLGPFLLTAEAGIGGSYCTPATCGRDDKGMFRSGLSIPMAVDARYVISAGNTNWLLNVLMVGARYTLATVELPTLTAGERTFTTHGGYAVVSYSLGDAANGPFLRRERAPLMEMVGTFGVLVAPNAPAETTGISGGIGLRFVIPL